MEILRGLSTTKVDTTRTRLGDILDGRTEDEDGLLLLREYEMMEEEYEASRGFRRYATKTQLMQDQHLSEYRRWLSPYLARTNNNIKLPNPDGPELDPAINDGYLFPQNYKLFIEYVGKYLLLAAANVKSKFRGDERPTVGILRNRRYSMHWWMLEKFPADQIQQRWRFLNDTHKAFAYAAKKYGLSNARKSNKLFFGKNELQDLMDHDMETTDYIEVAAQHHLAWAMTWAAGLRPGSMAMPKHHQDTLRWRDVKITRVNDQDVWKGSFLAEVCIRNLKTNRDDPDIFNRTHNVVFTPPRQAENLPFSVPHRMLCELIRRKFLADYEDIDQLLQDNRLVIQIKEEVLDQPVFLAVKRGGRGLTTNPMQSQSLGGYFGPRTLRLGYPDGCTLYAWRRGAATKVAREEGVHKARQFLAHDADSFTFERYYDNPTYDLDVFAIAAGENKAKNLERMQDADSVALHVYYAKVAKQAIDRQSVVEAWISQNETVRRLVDAGDYRGAKNERRRLRKHGMRAIYAEAREQAQREATTEDVERRKAELKAPSRMFRMIEERIQQAQSQQAMSQLPSTQPSNSQSLFLEEDDDNATEDLQPDLDDEIEDAAQYRDLEDELMDGGEEPIESFSAEGIDIDEIDASVWLSHVGHFMNLLLEEPNLKPGDERPCQLCIDDEYINPSSKNKMWANQAELQKHLRSGIHNPFQTWKRRMSVTQLTRSGSLKCPYGCGKKFPSIERLCGHIRRDKQTHLSEQQALAHETAKAADGWYNIEWTETRRTQNEIDSRKASDRRIQGYKFIDQRDEAICRMVDSNPDTVVMLAEGLPAVLQRAKQVAKIAQNVEEAAQKAGLSNGVRPTAQQLSQLSEAIDRSQTGFTSQRLSSGGGFDMEMFRSRLEPVTKDMEDQYRRRTAVWSGQVSQQHEPEKIAWLPTLEDDHTYAMLLSLADLVEDALPQGSHEEKTVHIYQVLRNRYETAITEGDNEAALSYDTLGRQIREHFEEMGGAVEQLDAEDE